LKHHSIIIIFSTHRKKVVLVGDGYCGKTCLQVVFRTDNFSDLPGGGKDVATGFDDVYRATLFENYATTFSFRDGSDGEVKTLEFAIWDTAGQEDYERLRPLSYPDTHVLLLCFAVDSPDTLANVEDMWKPELNYFCPDVPILLVGKKEFKPKSRSQTLNLAPCSFSVRLLHFPGTADTSILRN
jgi:small GTP-binding protein